MNERITFRFIYDTFVSNSLYFFSKHIDKTPSNGPNYVIERNVKAIIDVISLASRKKYNRPHIFGDNYVESPCGIS